MKTEDKLKVLEKVAAAFEKERITWALGASALLYFKGIAEDFGDIDIVTAVEEIPKIKEALRGVGEPEPENPVNRDKARAYLVYHIGGVEVEIMAGLVFQTENGGREFSLCKEDIKDCALLGNTRIPLQSLEEWKTYYSLMGRTEKVRMIDEWNPG